MRLEIPDGKLLVMWDKEKLNGDGNWVEDYHYGYIETILKNNTVIIVDVNTRRLEQVDFSTLRIIEHIPPEK